MDKQKLLLAARMLSIASDKFSNHGCNDLDEQTLSLITDEEALCVEIRKWNGEDDWPKAADWIGDSSLMEFLSDMLNNEASKS